MENPSNSQDSPPKDSESPKNVGNPSAVDDKTDKFRLTYSTPEWFLEHNVKLQTRLSDLDTEVLWAEERSDSTQNQEKSAGREASSDEESKHQSAEEDSSDSGYADHSDGTVSEACHDGNMTAAMNETKTTQETQHMDTKQDNNNKGQENRHRFKIEKQLYLELYDIAAGALVASHKDDFTFSNGSILLRSTSTVNMDFTNAMIVHLAKEMNADLISFDLGDLEDVAWELDSQEDELKIKAEKSKPSDENPDEAKKKKKSKKPKRPNLQVPFELTDFYFCPEDPVDYEATDSDDEDGESNEASDARKRNRRAMSAILEVSKSRKDPDKSMSNRHQNEVSGAAKPIFVHIRNANDILELGREGLRCIGAFHSWVKHRRALGQPMILFVSVSTETSPLKEDSSSSSCNCSICRPDGMSAVESKLRVELLADEDSILNVSAVDVSQDDEASTTKKQRESYSRKLRRGIRQILPLRSLASSAELITPYPNQDFIHSEDIATLLNKADLSDANARRAARQICGRTRGKSTLDIDDIRHVLSRVHSKKKEPCTQEHEQSFDELLDSIRGDCDRHEKELLNCVVDPKQLHTTYDDVIVDAETKETVKQLILLSKLRADGISQTLLQQIQIKGALFYGPPGTGKTHLSRAVAKESEANMLIIDAADMQNKYVGETEKLIRATFSLCVKLHPCVLFIDEADSLFRRRSSDDRTWERNAINLFLQQMDGLATTKKSPFVIVATNRPSDLDDAFLRRLPHKVLFGLPSEEEREKILRLFLKEDDIDYSITIDEIVKDTPGFSGADLRNLCGQAALAWAVDQVKPEQKTQSTTTQKLSLSAQHFAKALRRTRPSVSRQMQKDIEDFQVGSSGDNDRMSRKRPAMLGNRRIFDQ